MRPNVWGLLFIVIGGLWLLEELGLVRFFKWSLVAPVAIIAVGVAMLAKDR